MRPAFVRRVPERIFAIDTRSLALFRIGLGLLVVLDAAGRLPDLTALYSDAGAVPRALVRELSGDELPLSLYMAHGSVGFAGALLLLHVAAGVCLLAGYRTLLATGAAWVLTLSLQYRNPLVVGWGDMILRVLLLWSLFLPLAERASLDRRRGAPRQAARSFLSLGSAGFVLQLGSIYFFTALLKTGPEWRDGSAIAIALQNEHFAKLPQATVALGHPLLLFALTHTVRYFEAIGPLLLLVPVGIGPLRTALVLAYWAFHLGLFALLELGLFPFVCIAAWSALLPAAFWDRLGVSAGEGPEIRRRLQWPGLACIGLVLASNLSTLSPGGSVSALLRTPLRVSGLYQRWGMFAPSPSHDDGWLMVVGRRADGGEEDLLRGGAVQLSKPAEISMHYPSARWRTYLRGLWRRRPAVREAYADWRCRSENAARSDSMRLESLTIYFAKQVIAPSGESVRTDREQLVQSVCARPTP